MLSRPIPNKPLYLYLSIRYESIASVLVREEGSQQHPVYYVSKILRGAEIRYPKLDKLAMIVVHTSKKLRQYFQAHSIIIRINFPLRKILQRPETSGRLVQWSVQLGKFDISYESRQQIKAQALADFIQEITTERDSTSLVHPEWSLYIDRASGS